MRVFVGAGVLAAVLTGLVASNSARAIAISVPDVVGGAQNLRVLSPGSATAESIGYGNHGVGPGGDWGLDPSWDRPIIQFPLSAFSSLSGLTIVSATLHYSVASDFAEAGETGVSEVRLFKTYETELNFANRDVFAGLSGDGGAHTIVGSATFTDGMTGPQSLPFSPEALTALQGAINGFAPTLVVSFREFATTGGIGRVDSLDEFVLGIPPGNVSIEVTAVPEPSTMALPLCCVLIGLLGRHRCYHN